MTINGDTKIPTPHGDLLRRKAKTNPLLGDVVRAYEEFIGGAAALSIIDQDAVNGLVDLLNVYRNVSVYVFEGGRNVPQETLRSTIMEEFLGWLFKDIFLLLDVDAPANYVSGRAKRSYISLEFAPRSFPAIFTTPNPCLHYKDQDFAIGARIGIRVKGVDESAWEQIVLPVVAIECKTYLAKNHLDMCSSTAASLRRGMPYCMYLILAEFLKMADTVTPEFSDISEVFVVCKAKNGDRKRRKDMGLPPHPVYADVIWDLFQMVSRHLRSVWWDPESVITRGTVIGRPR